jgi:mitochondrial chaperone BCS1
MSSTQDDHPERLDPALSRPGRMDFWIEYRNACKWQAEAVFRNFFPSTDEDNAVLEGELEGVDLPGPAPSPQSPSPHPAQFRQPSGRGRCYRLYTQHAGSGHN